MVALVFHPSSGNGSDRWNEFIGKSRDSYLQLPVGEIERVYRVLDMDDGVTVHIYTDVLRAAADGDWEKVHHLAESIIYGPIQRQFKVSSLCALHVYMSLIFQVPMGSSSLTFGT
jgi:hypothetical protein